MTLLKLDKKYRATIIQNNDSALGMLRKIQHYVAWQEIDTETVKELLDKKARKSGYKKITNDDITSIGFKTIDELASSLADGNCIIFG